MELRVVESYDQLSEKAAEIVAAEVKQNRRAILGLATGSTPEGMYAVLAGYHRDNKIDFSGVTTFNLDEYTGLPREHSQSYYSYMHRHFFDHVNIDPRRIHLPESSPQDMARSCREYEQKIEEAGGIDLQVLGIGVNGHIGFNEPADSLDVYTHLVELAEETIETNSRFFNSREEVPQQAVTMGMGSIMHAAKILLLASGKNKARAIKKTVSGKITTTVPSSLLQMHRNCTVIVDCEAAALL
ncbi:MAG: glucosamine-6-phosphate deaminase [Bacillota bacterium]|nr:glucosamine-6-phosphate deaminase [Bacillota bacterium]